MCPNSWHIKKPYAIHIKVLKDENNIIHKFAKWLRYLISTKDNESQFQLTFLKENSFLANTFLNSNNKSWIIFNLEYARLRGQTLFITMENNEEKQL